MTGVRAPRLQMWAAKKSTTEMVRTNKTTQEIGNAKHTANHDRAVGLWLGIELGAGGGELGVALAAFLSQVRGLLALVDVAAMVAE